MTLPPWRKNRGKEFNLNRKLTLNTPITRDFIQGQGACTFRMDVPDGVYRILLLAGYPVEREQDPRVFEFEARTNLGAARFRKTYPRAWFELHGFKAKAAGGKLEIELVPIGGDDTWVVNGILVLDEKADRTALGKRATFNSLATHGFTVLDFSHLEVRPVKAEGDCALDFEKIRRHIQDFRDAGGTAEFVSVKFAGGALSPMLRAWAPDEVAKHEEKRIKEVINLTPKFRENFQKWIRRLDDFIRGQGIPYTWISHMKQAKNNVIGC